MKEMLNFADNFDLIMFTLTDVCQVCMHLTGKLLLGSRGVARIDQRTPNRNKNQTKNAQFLILPLQVVLGMHQIEHS